LPFYAKLPVHPHLANFCKRIFQCGLVTDDDFVSIIRKERPPMAIFATSWKSRDELDPYLKEYYVLKYNNPDLYVLKTLLDKAKDERSYLGR
jgi:hypothetical protein